MRRTRTSGSGGILGFHWSNILLVACVSIFVQICDALKDAEPGKDGAIAEQALESGQVIMRKSLSQSEALQACEMRGKSGRGRLATLLTIEDAKKLALAIQKVSSPYKDEKVEPTYELGMSRRYWIGLTDLAKEGEWVWQKEGSVLQYDDFWYPGQPDHLDAKGNKKEHCVTLWNPIFHEKETHTFNDEPCVNQHYFICENPPKADKAPAQSGRSVSGDTTIDEHADDESQKPAAGLVAGGKHNTSAAEVHNNTTKGHKSDAHPPTHLYGAPPKSSPPHSPPSPPPHSSQSQHPPPPHKRSFPRSNRLHYEDRDKHNRQWKYKDSAVSSSLNEI